MITFAMADNGNISDKQELDDAKIGGVESRIKDPAAFEALYKTAAMVAANVAASAATEMDAKESKVIESRVLACISIGLRGSFFVKGGEPDWDGVSAGYRLAWGTILTDVVNRQVAELRAEARSLPTEQERVDALEYVVKRSGKIRLAAASKVNTFTADILRSGLGVNAEGITGERARATMALFADGGKFHEGFPPHALRVLKSGLPGSWFTKPGPNGKTRKLASPQQVQERQKEREDAAQNKKAILEAAAGAAPQHVAEALAAASIREPVEVSADNALTVTESTHAAVRLIAGQFASFDAQFTMLETESPNIPLGSAGAQERTLTHIASVCSTIARQAEDLANRAMLLAHVQGDRLIATPANVDPAEVSAGQENTPEPEPASKPRSARVRASK